MGIARIAVLVVAALMAGVVAIYVRGLSRQPVVAPTLAPAGDQAIEAVRVLVADLDITYGDRLTPEMLTWRSWPDDGLSEELITDAVDPDAITTVSDAFARVDVARGEPITTRKIVRPGDAGFMAAVLAPGYRAVAVRTSAASGAGGFIKPGDRVDVILSDKGDEGGRRGGTANATTIMANVRVLAIDQTNVTDPEDPSVVGSTATLEATPADAELLVLAASRGELTLILRSLDSGAALAGSRVASSRRLGLRMPDQSETRVIYRFGTPTIVAVGGDR